MGNGKANSSAKGGVNSVEVAGLLLRALSESGWSSPPHRCGARYQDAIGQGAPLLGQPLAAIAQNLRRLAKLVARPPPLAAACGVIVAAVLGALQSRRFQSSTRQSRVFYAQGPLTYLIDDFCNKIRQKQKLRRIGASN